MMMEQRTAEQVARETCDEIEFACTRIDTQLEKLTGLDGARTTWEHVGVLIKAQEYVERAAKMLEELGLV